MFAGDQAAASRALSLVINESPEAAELSKAFFRKAGSVQKVGLFGPPGAGKSSLAARLVAHYRKAGIKVGVLAVDPSSHVSGGAFLGDRLRIQEHVLDPGVFIRSLATRGMVGGLSHTIFGAIHVLEAYGCGRILLETVGTGQDEVEIARVADTVVYVTTPQLGDEIQAMKAGAMEIGDCFVVNKSDLEGSDKALRDLRSALGLGAAGSGDWEPKVLKVSAAQDSGIAELAAVLDLHWEHLRVTPEGRRRLKVQHREELSLLISRRLYQRALREVSDKALEALVEHRDDPASMALRILRETGR